MCIKIFAKKRDFFKKKVFYKVVLVTGKRIFSCFKKTCTNYLWHKGLNKAILSGIKSTDGFHVYLNRKDALMLKEEIYNRWKNCYLSLDDRLEVIELLGDSENLLFYGKTDGISVDSHLDGVPCATFSKLYLDENIYNRLLEGRCV